VRTPVGRDLSGLLLEDAAPAGPDAVYFMTEDEISSGQTPTNALGLRYKPVVQPNHVETVITSLPDGTGRELWKYSRYFDPTGQRPDEFEVYNLSQDTFEERNLAHRKHETPLSQDVRQRLAELLADQRRQKRLEPR
jgi:hypothetical protein